MIRWLNFALTILSALRLHTGTITPLQLTLKIGDVEHDRNQAGATLMGSINLQRSFTAALSLINMPTMKFSEYFGHICKTLYNPDMINMYGKFTVALNLALVKHLGANCIAEIPDYGKLFPNESLDCIPVNSWAKMLNLSKLQIKEILMKLTYPDRMNDILFTGFLLFDNVTNPEILADLLGRYRSVFDGPFCEFNVKHPLILVLQFLEIGDDEIQMDVGDLLHETYSEVAHELITKRIGVTRSSLDLISRFMQLASAFTYLSGSSRVSLLSDTMTRIKLVVIALFDFVMIYQLSFGCWSLEVKTAAHLARIVVDKEFLIADFDKLVLKSGYGRRIGFYQMLIDMTEQIIETDEASSELVTLMTQMKIEALGLMTLFMPASETMYKLVKAILEYRNVKQKPYCRHLFVLLWALGSGHNTPYKDSCKLLMDYILHNMPSGSNLFAFKRLNVLRHAPINVWLTASRQDLSGDVGMTIVAATLNLDDIRKVKLFRTDHNSRSTLAPNGYLDVQEARTQILFKCALILQNYFVYCGHRNGVPVYIQSLGCHQDISSLLQLFIIFASRLRLKLPFTLHPAMVLKVTEPENPDHGKNYLRVAVQYEFGHSLPVSSADTIVKRALALLDCFIDGWECGLDDWAAGIVKFGRRSFAKNLKLLKERLKTLGLQLVKNTVMPICFEGKFEAALITLPGLQDILRKDQ